MADDIRLAGLKFVTQDYANFRNTVKSANSLIDTLNRNLSTTAKSSFSGAGSSLSSFSKITVSSKRDILDWVNALTVASYGVERFLEGIKSAADFVTEVPVAYENAFINIAKTVDNLVTITDKGLLELTDQGAKLKEALKGVSEEAPVTFEELTKIGELGGQLGILEGIKDPQEIQDILVTFTKTISGLSEATDLTQQDAATRLSQIVNIYRDSIDDIGGTFEDLGNVVVRLGNESATTESQIVAIARRIASAGKVAGLALPEIFALGAAISSTGLTAEAGGSAITRGLLILNSALTGSKEVVADNAEEIGTLEQKVLDLNAKLVRLEYQTGETGRSLVDQKNAFVEAGGSVEDFGRTLGVARRQQLFKTQEAIDDLTTELAKLRAEDGKVTQVTEKTLRTFAKTAGLTVDEFKAVADADPAEALTLFIEGLKAIEDAGGDTSLILDEIGLTSIEAQRTFLGLASSGSLLRDTLAKANQELENGNALVSEVSRRYSTLASRQKILTNTFRNTRDEIGVGFIPALSAILDQLTQITDLAGKRVPQSFGLLLNALRPLEQLDISFNISPVDLVELGFDKLDTFLTNLNIQPLVDLVLQIKSLNESKITIFSQLEQDVYNFAKALELVFPQLDISSKIRELIAPQQEQTIEFPVIARFNITEVEDLDLSNLPKLDQTLELPLIGQIEPGQFTNDLMQAIADLDLVVPQSTIDSFNELNDSWRPFIEETLPSLTKNLIELGQNIFTLDNLAKIITDLNEVGIPQAIVDFISTLVEINFERIQSTIDILSGLNNYLAGLNTQNESLRSSGALEIGQAIVDGIIDPINSVTDLQLDSSTIFGSLLEDIEDLRELGQALSSLGEALVKFNNSAQPLEALDTDAISGSISGTINAVTTDDVTDFVNQITSIVTWLTNLNTSVGSLALDEGISSISSFFASVKEWSDNVDVASFRDVTQGIQDALNYISNFDTTLLGGTNIKIEDFINVPTAEDWKIFASFIATSLVESIQGAVDSLGNLQPITLSLDDLVNIPDITQSSIDFATDLFTDIQGAVDSLGNLQPFKISLSDIIEFTGIDEVTQKLIQAIANIDLFGIKPFESLAPPEIEDPDFTTAIEKFGEAPELMADSFVQGMDREDKTFTERVKDTGTKIKESILDVLGFHSPSQFFIDIGKDIIASIAIGIGDLTAINLAFVSAIQDEVIPTTIEWDDASTEVADTIETVVLSAIDSLIELILDLTDTIDANIDTTKNWASTFTTVLIPALEKTNTQLLLIETRTELVTELIDELTKSYLSLAAAITSANEAGSVAIPVPASSGVGAGGGAAPFQLGGSFIVPSAIPTQLKGRTGGMQIEVHPGEYVQVIPKAVTTAINRIPTHVPNPFSQTMRQRSVSGQSISNVVDNSVTHSAQDLHLHVSEMVTPNVRDSFELMRVLSGR